MLKVIFCKSREGYYLIEVKGLKKAKLKRIVIIFTVITDIIAFKGKYLCYSNVYP